MNHPLHSNFVRRATLAAGIVAAFCATALVPGVAAQGSRKDDIAFNSQGRPLAGATIRVCTSQGDGQPCTPLASIYSDLQLSQPQANPFTADGLGNYSFYALPGRYLIEISGPGIITKQFADVILPNDPSGDQRFAGPSPWIDIRAMNPPACTFNSNVAGNTATIAQGSTTLTTLYSLEALGFSNGCGIMIHGAGMESTMDPPTAITVVRHNASGSGATTYNYKIVAVDGNLHGTSPASSAGTTTTGDSALSKYRYNFVTWTPPAGTPLGYIVYGDKGLGGAYVCLGVTRVAAWEDMGFYGANKPPCPTWAPATPPATPGKQTLITSLVSGSETVHIVRDPAITAVTDGLVHPDNTEAFTAALQLQCLHSSANVPDVYIPVGSFGLVYMPVVPPCTWKIRSDGSLFFTDGFGMDVPASASWTGRAGSINLGIGGAVPASFVGGTIDGPGNTSVVAQPIVILGTSASVDGIFTRTQGDGISIINSAFITAKNIMLSCYEHCGGSLFRIIGLNIGPNLYGPGTLAGSNDASALGDIYVDGSIEGGEHQVGSGLVHISNLNFIGNPIHVSCPIGCSKPASGDFSLLFWDIEGGLTENQPSPHWLLFDPGTTTEGMSAFGISHLTIDNHDVDNNFFQGPTVGVLNPPNNSGGGLVASEFRGNGVTGAAVVSIDMTGNVDYKATNSQLSMFGAGCSDGGTARWANSGNWGPVRGRGSCYGSSGAGIQGNLGVYQAGGGETNYNFATLLPAPTIDSSSTTTGTLTGTYYFRATAYDCAGRESQPGPEFGPVTVSGQGIILNTPSSWWGLNNQCGINIYFGTTKGGENKRIGASAPTSTRLDTYTFSGAEATPSVTPPTSSQAFESWFAEVSGAWSCLFCGPAAANYGHGLGIGVPVAPNGATKLAVAGNARLNSITTTLAAKSSNYTLTVEDSWVNVTGTTTITLPHAATGHRWDVFNSGTNTVTIQADSGTVNGAASITLTANTGREVTCDGTNCFAH